MPEPHVLKEGKHHWAGTSAQGGGAWGHSPHGEDRRDTITMRRLVGGPPAPCRRARRREYACTSRPMFFSGARRPAVPITTVPGGAVGLRGVQVARCFPGDAAAASDASQHLHIAYRHLRSTMKWLGVCRHNSRPYEDTRSPLVCASTPPVHTGVVHSRVDGRLHHAHWDGSCLNRRPTADEMGRRQQRIHGSQQRRFCSSDRSAFEETRSWC